MYVLTDARGVFRSRKRKTNEGICAGHWKWVSQAISEQKHGDYVTSWVSARKQLPRATIDVGDNGCHGTLFISRWLLVLATGFTAMGNVTVQSLRFYPRRLK